ncbi:putative cAMP receptor protein [Streptomyces alboflavus]|uniref:Putative cAMP receptor protein n=1 Tax=Streptomyces alboflavus TaxID=67267 RepID=A0A1Z1WQG7_9ACTN|nr:putative cAMP receptor protein [Streptomyces alboflavus]
MPSTLKTLPPADRQRLMDIAREVSFPQGARLFEEGGHADRFWIIRTGTVALDLHVPGRRGAVIESLGHSQLVGWSWLFAPYVWHLGGEATAPVRAYEFDAPIVRTMCQEDPTSAGTSPSGWEASSPTGCTRHARGSSTCTPRTAAAAPCDPGAPESTQE